MAEVKNFYRLFEKNLFSLIGKRSAIDKEKFLFYFRLYNHLLNALNLMNTPYNKRAFDFIRIVAELTAKQSFKGEEHYLKYINSIARELLSMEQRIRVIVKKDPASDPLHGNTKLIIAQNICTLRILKINGSV